MENDVIVRISGLQITEDTGESMEILSEGKYYMKNQNHYLFYEDIDEDSGLITKNSVKFNDTCMEVKRNGPIKGKLVFDKGNNNQSIYSTPYGDLLVEIMTRDVMLKQTPDNVYIKVDYELYANNSKVSDREIEIDIKGKTTCASL